VARAASPKRRGKFRKGMGSRQIYLIVDGNKGLAGEKGGPRSKATFESRSKVIRRENGHQIIELALASIHQPEVWGRGEKDKNRLVKKRKSEGFCILRERKRRASLQSHQVN